MSCHVLAKRAASTVTFYITNQSMFLSVPPLQLTSVDVLHVISVKTRTICSLPATFWNLEQTFYSICYYILEKESKFTFLGMRKTGSWDAEFIWILCCCCFSSVLTGLYIFSIGSIDSWKTINTVGFVSSLTIIIFFILFLNVGNLTLCFYSNAAWLSGIVQTGIYADFFYYYIKRYILFCYAISGEMQIQSTKYERISMVIVFL